MGKIRKPTTNIFRLLFLLIAVTTLILCAVCLYYSYFYFYRASALSNQQQQELLESQSSPSTPIRITHSNVALGADVSWLSSGSAAATNHNRSQNNVTLVQFPSADEASSGSGSAAAVADSGDEGLFAGAPNANASEHVPGQFASNHRRHTTASSGASSPSSATEKDNKLLETISKKNTAKLNRELIYIYKLPPVTDEDYEQEQFNLDPSSKRQRNNGPAGVWLFDDLDTDASPKNKPSFTIPLPRSRFSKTGGWRADAASDSHYSRFHVNVNPESRELNMPSSSRDNSHQSMSKTASSGPKRGSSLRQDEKASTSGQPPPAGLNAHLSERKKGPSRDHSASSHGERRRQGETIKYYDTGHFRDSGAEIWDPHPQYLFDAFGHRFHLLLNLIPQRHSLLTPNFKVTTHSQPLHNESQFHRDNLRRDIGGCFYNGVVLGDSQSSVAVSLCHGMTGHIRTAHGSYFIEPVPQRHHANEFPESEPKGRLQYEAKLHRHNQHQQQQQRGILHEIYQVGMNLSNEAEVVEEEETSDSSEDYSYETYDNLKIGSSTLEVYDDEYDFWFNPSGIHQSPTTWKPTRSSRVKRSMSKERYVELSVVTDSTMSTYHGENLKHYVLTLLSIVALIYRDASIGNPVNIALVSFHVLPDKNFATNNWSGGTGNDSSAETLPGISASEMLRNFCKWQKEHNILDDKSPHHHDTALLLTRETICRNPWLHKCDTLGLAELGTMCDHYASCAIVQDNGLSAAFTIAHELGHVMNMPHDDDYKCQSFLDSQSNLGPSTTSHFHHHQFTSDMPTMSSNTEPQHYVMSRMLDHNTYPWAWSRCSRHFLTEFLDAGHGYCLEDKPGSNLLIGDADNPDSVNLVDNFTSPQQPGEIFSEHKQCELVFGPSSQLCSYMPPCRRLWCTTGTTSEEQEGCRTQHMPWADGTPCGTNNWCQRGACVKKDLEKLKTVNGGWGPWMDYGVCSRTCGGGVRKSYRECDNPRPSNGGKYCVGPRVRYESCNTHECSNESDYRAEQCARFNNDNFNIQGLPKDITWVPKYHGISPKDQCKLFCRVQGSSSYYLLREKVIDGTPCGIDTFDVCVNGVCLPAGCDRRLHSNKKLDVCGICGGDGMSCRTIRGSFNESRYGYNNIIRIPAGASNIDIRQRSYDDTARDDNYLALLDNKEEYILNGHFVVSMFRKTIHYAGSLLEYSGSDEIVERINSSSRPIRSTLVLQVLSVGKLYPPDVHYQYVISLNFNAGEKSASQSDERNSNAAWSFSGRWTSCTEICEGSQSEVQICVDSASGSEISAEYCRGYGKLPSSIRACNTHCKLRWTKVQQPCDCLFPNRTEVRLKCVREMGGNLTYISDAYCLKLDRPDVVPNCGEECSRPKWRWTQWSECSVRCGDGVQIRNVWCQKYNVPDTNDNNKEIESTYVALPDSECDGTKPNSKRKCHNGACGKWKIDEWSPCSSTCGQGISRAAYACYLDDAILPSDYCLNQPKPPLERSCEAEVPCVQWAIITSGENFVTEFDEENYWSECTDRCNPSEGYQTRPLVCVVQRARTSRKLKQVRDSLCNRLLPSKPAYKRSCSNATIPHDCYLSSAVHERVPTASRAHYTSHFRNRNGIDNVIAHADVPAITMPLISDNRIDGTDDPNLSSDWVMSSWSDCFQSSENVIRIREVSCPRRFCSEQRPHATRVCGSWFKGEWNNCNATCDSELGYETRVVKCVRSLDNVSSHLEDLDCLTPKPDLSRTCTKDCKPKGRWRTGAWSKCSQTCGVIQSDRARSQRIRQVVCVDDLKPSKILPDEDCDVQMKPESTSDCLDSENKPCPVWSASDWGPCMATTSTAASMISNPKLHSTRLKMSKKDNNELCSNESGLKVYGHRERVVKCQDQNGHEIPEYHCYLLNKRPESKEVCVLSNKKCFLKYNYRWRIGPWSKCSKSCGTKGVKSRRVECMKINYATGINDTLHVDDKFCLRRKRRRRKPRTERRCARFHCPFKWVTSDWSECSRTCGYGIKKRQVSCHKVNKLGWTDPDPVNACEDIEKPKEYNYCRISENCSNTTLNFAWKTDAWSACPDMRQFCDQKHKIRQVRRVYCTLHGRKRPRRYCAKLAPKPRRKRRCPQVSCGWKSCQDVRESGNFYDGEYEMLVAGLNMSIYCHGLSTSNPREYLTLWYDSVSEIYEKRLIRPETCPRNGSRLDSCECVHDRNRRSGLTKWTKLRLNVTNLRIDSEDYTFAKSSGDLIPFGTAGDCYSSSTICPQGIFRIDLRKTKLAVNSLSTWLSQGHKPTMQITKSSNSQKVEGKCGGYCGTCSPNRITGLKLEVVL